MTDRQTVAGAYAKITSHEDLCSERYRQINETLGELKDGARTHNKLLITSLLALLGWAGIQLWNGQVAHSDATLARPPFVGTK